MKMASFIFTIIIFLSSCSDKKQISLSLELKSNIFKASEDVLLTIKLKNITKEDIIIPGLIVPQDHSIRFELYDKNNKKIKFTGPQYKLKYQKPIKIKSNEYYSKDFNLRNYFALKPDNYKLKVIYNTKIKTKNMKIVKSIKFSIKSELTDIDKKDKNGNTKLILAVKDNNFDDVKKLLRNGANPNIYNKNKKTALDYIHKIYLSDKREGKEEGEGSRSTATTVTNVALLHCLRDDNEDRDREKDYYIKELLSIYGAKFACQIIDVKCAPLSNSFIERVFVSSIVKNDIKYIKHWIKVNEANISLVDLYSYLSHVINLMIRDKKTVIDKVELLKLFLINNKSVNKIKKLYKDKYYTMLDFALEEYKRNKNKSNKQVITYLKSKGAKRACEILGIK